MHPLHICQVNFSIPYSTQQAWERPLPPHFTSLLFLHDIMVPLEALVYTLSSLARSQMVLPNKKAPSSPDCEVVIWRVDVKLPSRSALRLWSVRRCWRGNGQPPSRRGVPGGAGLSY